MMHKQKRIALALVLVLLTALIPSALAAAQTATVTGNGVNLRAGPSTAASRVGILYKGDEVTVLGKTGAWYRVTKEGADGYVHGDYITLTGTSATLLSYGNRGEAVRTLQADLIKLGYLGGSADGIFGRLTRTAVRLYQQRNALSVDGAAGKQTLGAIAGEVGSIEIVLSVARAYLGTDYVYGGSDPGTGFDCSGLTQYAFSRAGISIPRVSYRQAEAGVAVPKDELRAGDLVAFNSSVSHVGIYIGDGKFIHSPKTGDVVKITSLKYMNLTAVRRFTGVSVG